MVNIDGYGRLKQKSCPGRALCLVGNNRHTQFIANAQQKKPSLSTVDCDLADELVCERGRESTQSQKQIHSSDSPKHCA